MISLNTPVTLPAVQRAVARAWDWWTNELRDSVPRTLRDRLAAPRPLVLIHIGEAEATISRADADRLRQVARIDLSTESASLDGARHALAQLERPRIVVCLASLSVLRRDLELPQSAEPNLREIVRLDLDRLTPFAADDALFDVAIRERLPEAGRIVVDMVVARRETVEAALALCRALGVEPERIAIGDEGDAPPAFDLLPARRGRLRLDPREHMMVAAGIAIALLLLLDFGLALSRMDTRIDQLSAELAKARVEAQATDKLRAELTRSDAEARLLKEAQAHLSPLQTLDALTRALPDDVWLFDFQLNDGAGQIAGFAPSAAGLIARLDKTGGLANPRFKAPVTRTGNANDDRFEIGFDLAVGGAK